jgi:hypothetical protein
MLHAVIAPPTQVTITVHGYLFNIYDNLVSDSWAIQGYYQALVN